MWYYFLGFALSVKVSVINVQRLVFKNKHCPNLGKFIIYQELVYIFQGYYRGYVKCTNGFM